ncbi:hypothetical protein [Mumia zhuanghuii]|uniref:Uncharacterized protein n=1 Tax=Mumia zhuanghuii TaxID=2585211 RepID=A0A5C4M3Z7_9ACTN|nr:hypothetical protein [Mumia zhuanghuii]TNC26009.1 hypothetical protein FHE65_34740 [Mumia zhuanghuii]
MRRETFGGVLQRRACRWHAQEVLSLPSACQHSVKLFRWFPAEQALDEQLPRRGACQQRERLWTALEPTWQLLVPAAELQHQWLQTAPPARGCPVSPCCSMRASQL